MTVVLDPTGGRTAEMVEPSPRLDALTGKTIGLLDISKPRGDILLNQLELRLRDLGADIKRFRKPTFSKPAPVDLRHEIASSCDAVIEALAD